MSKKTKHVNVMVVSRGTMAKRYTFLALTSLRKMNKVPRIIMREESTTLKIRSRVIMGCLVLRGGCFSTS
ncbi:unnamed protein product [Ixodes persulcatus]